MKLSAVKVQSLIDEGMRQSDVAQIFGVTQSAISRICNNTSPKTKQVKICSCCGTRPVAEGNRFLCSKCFTEGTQYTELKVLG